MPKSRRNRRKSAAGTRPGADPVPGRTRRRLIAGVLVVFLAVMAGVFVWRLESAERAFLALAEKGRPDLNEVVLHPSLGSDHVPSRQSVRYGTRFPLSGPHWETWTEPGFYETPQRPERLVHALEHGNIVIYYDDPGKSVLYILRGWTDLYRGPWSGIVAVPKAGLGAATVLTAWRHTLRLEPFDAARAAAFIDAYRGRGPEHPVR